MTGSSEVKTMLLPVQREAAEVSRAAAAIGGV